MKKFFPDDSAFPVFHGTTAERTALLVSEPGLLVGTRFIEDTGAVNIVGSIVGSVITWLGPYTAADVGLDDGGSSDISGPMLNRQVNYAALTAINTRTVMNWGNYIITSVHVQIIPTGTVTTDNGIFWVAIDPVSDAQADIFLDDPTATDGTVSEKRIPLTVKQGREGGLWLPLRVPIATLYFKNAAALLANESYKIFVTATSAPYPWPL